MADVTVVAADVRPLPGCLIRRFSAGGTITVGAPVYINANDTVSAADGSAVSTSFAIGICVSGNGASKTVPVSGDEVDVVLFGPVAGYSTNMVAGGVFWVSDTTGTLCDAASGATKDTVMGIGLSATVLLVRPQIVEFS